jgi:predicted ATP-dependent serine protease
MSEMEVNYVKKLSLGSNGSFNLQDVFPGIPTPFWVHPGETILFGGDTKLGKTAFVQNIAVRVNTLKTLYFNSEISEQLLFRRTMQIAHNLNKGQVDVHYDINNNSLSKKGVELDSLRKTIINGGFKLIILDTIGGLSAGKLGEYSTKEDKIADYLKELALGLDVIIFEVWHISKSAITGFDGKRKDLNIHSFKGSAALEQMADKVILFEGKQDDSLRTITSAGARDETPFKITTKYHWDTFSFSNFIG